MYHYYELPNHYENYFKNILLLRQFCYKLKHLQQFPHLITNKVSFRIYFKLQHKVPANHAANANNPIVT